MPRVLSAALAFGTILLLFVCCVAMPVHGAPRRLRFPSGKPVAFTESASRAASSARAKVYGHANHPIVCAHMRTHFAAGGAGKALFNRLSPYADDVNELLGAAAAVVPGVIDGLNWWTAWDALPNGDPARAGLAKPATNGAVQAVARDIVESVVWLIRHDRPCTDLMLEPVCASMLAHFQGGGAGNALLAGAMDTALGQLAFTGGGANAPNHWWGVWTAACPVQGIATPGDDVAVKAAARIVFPLIQWRVAQGRAVNTCQPRHLRIAALRASAAAAVPVASCTIGVEWELHMIELAPDVNNNMPVTIAHTGLMAAPFANIHYLRVSSDHGHGRCVPELVFGPMNTGAVPGADLTGLDPVTATAIKRVHTVVEAFKAAALDRAKAVYTANKRYRWTANNGLRYKWGAATLPDIGNTFNGLLPGGWGANYHFTTYADPHHYAGALMSPIPRVPVLLAALNPDPRPLAVNTVSWQAVPRRNPLPAKSSVELHDAADAVMMDNIKNHQMNGVQVNYAVPIASLASDAWIELHRNRQNIVTNLRAHDSRVTAQYGMAKAARVAAAMYLTTNANFPAALLGTLSRSEKADLFGLFTLWFHQMSGQICYDHPVFVPSVGGTIKNIYNHMIKTNPHTALSAMPIAVQEVIQAWYDGHMFQHTPFFLPIDTRLTAYANANEDTAAAAVRAIFDTLRTAWWQSDSVELKEVANSMLRPVDVPLGVQWRTIKNQNLNQVRQFVDALDPSFRGVGVGTLTGAALPVSFITPSGGGAPLVGVVVESRKHYNEMTEIIQMSTPPHTSASVQLGLLLKPLCRAHTWDGAVAPADYSRVRTI